jgi:hypothetical protein
MVNVKLPVDQSVYVKFDFVRRHHTTRGWWDSLVCAGPYMVQKSQHIGAKNKRVT